MKTFKGLIYYSMVAIVILAILTHEVDARRKILRGRKTITRTYYKAAGIPAWAIAVIIGFGQIIVGGIIYLIMKKLIIDPPLTGSYTPTHTNVH